MLLCLSPWRFYLVKLVYKEYKFVGLAEKFIYLTLLRLVFRCIGIIICVPFLTLFERKVLSYTQNRKGPKKISVLGLLQPIVDGLKLIIKESGNTLLRNKFIYFFSPLAVFCLSITRILILSKTKKSWIFNLKFLFFLVLVSCKIFPLFFSGVARNRKYSCLGSFRGAAQVIAFEVNAVVRLLIPFVLLKRFCSYWLSKNFKYLIFLLPFLFFIWIFCIICETNRAPFDFAEGERELVSGYKTEYSGLNFTLLFLAEYSNIIIMSVVTSIIFFAKNIIVSLFIIYIFIKLRASFPRFRYDLLMIFSWKVILPIVLLLFRLRVLL